MLIGSCSIVLIAVHIWYNHHMSEQERISRIVTPIAEKYGVKRISLFGSRARGEDNADSDYDFLISKGNLNSLLHYVSFVNELEEVFGAHVDVVSDTACDKDFMNNISKETVLLYER